MFEQNSCDRHPDEKNELLGNDIEFEIKDVDVKIERYSDDEIEIEIDNLYADHVIKEEIVVGPEVLQRAVHNEDYAEDATPHESPELHTQNIKTEQSSNLQKKSTHKKDTKEGFAPNITLNKNKRKIKTRNCKPQCKTSEKILKNGKNNTDVKSCVVVICKSYKEYFAKKCELIKLIECHDKTKLDTYLKRNERAYQTVIRKTLERRKKELKKVKQEKKNYICDVCEFKTNSFNNLNIHSMIHTDEKPLSCSECEYKCSQKSDLTKHLKIHTAEKSFSCSECEDKFSEKSHLISHLEIHTGEKPVSRSKCEYKCSQKSDLTNHLKIDTGEKPLSCSECDYKCSQNSDMTKHLRIHTGEKPFSCSECEYKCSQKSHLTRHLLIHTGEKPFSCSMCEYKCSIKSNLTSHLKIHTGEKPFSCSECGYKCSYKSNLTKHLKVHIGKKTFSCSECDYRCYHEYKLGRHLKIHTG